MTRPNPPPAKRAPNEDLLQHEITVDLASGARLTILSFSDREQRWIFAYKYMSEKMPGGCPEIVNDVRLVAEYVEGSLAPQLVLSMHVILPHRLGQQVFAGVDISPGAKTCLEFNYAKTDAAYQLVEICKGARERVRLDAMAPALVRLITFPFPIPDRILIEYGKLHVPFRANAGSIAYFDLPASTLRCL